MEPSHPDDAVVTDYPAGELPRDEAYESSFAFVEARDACVLRLKELGAPEATGFESMFLDWRIVGVFARFEEVDGALAPFIVEAQRGRGLGHLALEHLADHDLDLAAVAGTDLAEYALRRGFSPPPSGPGPRRFLAPQRAGRVVRGASIALYHPPSHRVLLGKRLTPPLLGSWSFPGGKLDPGEDALTAARREMREEVGIDVSEEVVMTTRVYGGNGDVVYALDCFSVVVSAPRDPLPSEEMEAAWVALDDAPALRPFAPGTQRVLRRMRRRPDLFA